MRILVLFDLPVTTLDNKRSYRIFRKYLLKNGFMMMQESVYCRMVHNQFIARLHLMLWLLTLLLKMLS